MLLSRLPLPSRSARDVPRYTYYVITYFKYVVRGTLIRFNVLCKAQESLDLHILGTPLAFILSQDQTLKKRILISFHLFIVKIVKEHKKAYPIGVPLSDTEVYKNSGQKAIRNLYTIIRGNNDFSFIR